MTVTEYLEQIKTARQEVEYCRHKIDELHDIAMRISGCSFEEHNSPNRQTEARFVKYLDEIAEMQTELEQKREKYMTPELEITHTLMSLPDPQERQVLELIFLHGLTTQETAKQMLLSTATVKRRKADALLELEKMLHDEPQ